MTVLGMMCDDDNHVLMMIRITMLVCLLLLSLMKTNKTILDMARMPPKTIRSVN